jgi:plastocyanin
MRKPASIPAAAVALGCFAFASPALAAPATVNVDDNFFSPANVSINSGESITWKFVGGGHNVDVISGPEKYRTDEIDKGGTVTKAFTKAGTYEYICDFHSDMAAKFTVVAAPAGGGGGGSTQPPASGGGTAQPAPASGGGTAQPAAGSPAASLGAALPGTVDLAPPTLRNRGLRGRTLNLNLSENAKVVVRYVKVGARGHKVHKRTVGAKRGTLRLNLKKWMRSGQYRFSILAFDGGGNMGTPLRLKLNVRR